MSLLKLGFARVNIDPHLGIAVFGYYKPRFAKGYLDELTATGLAFSCGEKDVLMLSVDTCEITEDLDRKYRILLSEKTGIAMENIFLHSIHTHTGPCIFHNEMFNSDDAEQAEYAHYLGRRLVDAALLALADRKPARMGFIVGKAPDRVAYIRRYKMKDGRTCTCPPIADPLIDHPIGELDQRVNVLRFDREGGDTVVLMNYGIHSDTINSDYLSPDFCGWMRKTFEAAVPGTKLVFICGCQGDVGSTHVWPAPGDMNDTEISFDNEMKSPGMARFVGRALCGTVLQVFDKAEYVDVEDIDVMHVIKRVPSNMAAPEQLPLAHKYKDLHDAGRDEEIPFEAMELTTVVAEATRMVRLENGPDHFDIDIMGFRIGPVAFVGIPGEPFTKVGVEIKKGEGYKCILPTALVNGGMGYFPMKDAFDEGGYEARSSDFKGGVAETIIEGGLEVLEKLRKTGC